MARTKTTTANVSELPQLADDVEPPVANTFIPLADDPPQPTEPVADQVEANLLEADQSDVTSEAPVEPPPPQTLFDRLKAEAESKKIAADSEWQAIVEKLATDNATEMEATELLSRTGRSLDDLKAATDRQRRINHLAALLQDLPAINAEYQAARAAQKNLEADHKRRQKEMEEEFRQSRRVVTSVRMRLDRANDAHAEMWRINPEYFSSAEVQPQTTVAEDALPAEAA